MLIFISGSINAGKTTTSKVLAERLGWPLINVDDLTDKVEGFDIYTHLDLAMDLAIVAINEAAKNNKNVVANFVVRKEDYERMEHEIHAHPQVFITLSPCLEIAQSQRGDRVLTTWEIKRIKAHYDDGIAAPEYGYVIDNSHLTVEETVAEIMSIIAEAAH
ncbi:MAG: shikimate kinase [Candidatus Saccharibacteria bacterium]|nr:shikimate kinase [Candidatus Saccharibacteria bacterium]